MAAPNEPFVLDLSVDNSDKLDLRLLGPDGALLGERTVTWTGTETWFRQCTERGGVYEAMATSSEGDPAAKMGQILYDKLLGPDFGAPIVELAARSDDVLLQIECPRADPRLVGIPWTLLHDGTEYLHRRGVGIAARFAGTERRLAAGEGPLRVLVMFAAPWDAEVPPVEAELDVFRRLYASLAAHVHVTELSYGVQIEDLERAWTRAKGFHAVHLVCPATADTLLLEGDDGASDPVPWAALATVIAAHTPPWFVTLGTGRWPRDPWRLDYNPARDGVPEEAGEELSDALDWNAMRLTFARAGVPAVLAYQLPLDARAARHVTERFCRGLLSCELTVGAAWRLAVQTLGRPDGEGAPQEPAPALIGDVARVLPCLPEGPTMLPGRADRNGVDVGLFPEKPTGREFSGRYHLTTQFLRKVLIGTDHSALLIGPPGVGKTSFVQHALALAADAVHAVCWVNLHTQSSAASLFDAVSELCEANGWPVPEIRWPTGRRGRSPAARAAGYSAALARALQGRRAIVVVDELERALEPESALLRDETLGWLLALLARDLEGSGIWLCSTRPAVLGESDLPARLASFRMSEPAPYAARELFERHDGLSTLDLQTHRTMYLATRGLPGVLGSLNQLAGAKKIHGVLADLVPRRLRSDSEAVYREDMCRLVAMAVLSLQSREARRMLAFVSLCEGPERRHVAAQLGIEAGDDVIAELEAAGLVERLRRRDVYNRQGDRGPFGLWMSEPMRRAAQSGAAACGVDPFELIKQLGASHALAAIEQERVEADPTLALSERVELRRRRRRSLRRAFSYFVRARQWQQAGEVAVRAREVMASQAHLRDELRRMMEMLADRRDMPQLAAIATLRPNLFKAPDEDAGYDDEVMPWYGRAVQAARTAERPDAEADLLLRIGRFQASQGQGAWARDSVRSGLALAEELGDTALIARAHASAATIAQREGNAEDAAASFARAARRFERCGALRRAASCRRACAESLVKSFAPRQAVAALVAAWQNDPTDVVATKEVLDTIIASEGLEAVGHAWQQASGAPVPPELLGR